MINFDYSRAASIQSAIELLMKDATGQFIAGGTNLVDLMKRGVARPQRLVDITRLSLRVIEKRNAMLYIGALATNAEVAEHPIVINEYPLLSLALKAGASPQLRNMATVGGNMMQRTRCTYFYDTAMPCNKRSPGSGCSALKGYNRMHAIFGTSDQCIAVHPSDMCVALAALDTTVIVQGKQGERRIAFADFHRLPGNTPQKDNILEKTELITGIEIAPALFGKHVHYLKIRDRSSYAFALVSVAAALQIENNTIRDARLVMGGVAHKPWKLFSVENYLKGKSLSAAIFKTAAEMAMKDAKDYGYNNFKLRLAPASLVEALRIVANK
jgi:xanthine dehydrogenase YagS FAD-binding subunit